MISIAMFEMKPTVICSIILKHNDIYQHQYGCIMTIYNLENYLTSEVDTVRDDFNRMRVLQEFHVFQASIDSDLLIVQRQQSHYGVPSIRRVGRRTVYSRRTGNKESMNTCDTTEYINLTHRKYSCVNSQSSDNTDVATANSRVTRYV